MSKIKLLTDSACDIPQERAEALGIEIMSIPITIGQEGYRERIDFTSQQFYNILLESPVIPATSHITNLEFCDAYYKIYQQGYTDIIHVTINSTGSNMYNAALMARNMLFEEYPETVGKLNVHIVDSKTYSMGYGYPVIKAAKQAIQNVPVGEILAYLRDWFDSVEIYLGTYTLDFAKKSGRINCAAAFVGEMMGLRPIISLIDGNTKIVAKVRGDANVVPRIVKTGAQRMQRNSPYLVVKGMLDQPGDDLYAQMEQEVGYFARGIYHAGASISINAGPKIAAVVVKGPNRTRK